MIAYALRLMRNSTVWAVVIYAAADALGFAVTWQLCALVIVMSVSNDIINAVLPLEPK